MDNYQSLSTQNIDSSRNKTSIPINTKLYLITKNLLFQNKNKDKPIQTEPLNENNQKEFRSYLNKSTRINQSFKNKLTSLYTEALNSGEDASNSQNNYINTSNCNYISTISSNNANRISERNGNYNNPKQYSERNSSYLNTLNNYKSLNHGNVKQTNNSCFSEKKQETSNVDNQKLQRVKSDIYVMLGESNKKNKKKEQFKILDYNNSNKNENLVNDRFKLKKTFLEKVVIKNFAKNKLLQTSMSNPDFYPKETNENMKRPCKYKNWLKEEIKKEKATNNQDGFYSLFQVKYAQKNQIPNPSVTYLKNKMDLLSITSPSKNIRKNY